MVLHFALATQQVAASEVVQGLPKQMVEALAAINSFKNPGSAAHVWTKVGVLDAVMVSHVTAQQVASLQVLSIPEHLVP